MHFDSSLVRGNWFRMVSLLLVSENGAWRKENSNSNRIVIGRCTYIGRSTQRSFVRFVPLGAPRSPRRSGVAGLASLHG